MAETKVPIPDLEAQNRGPSTSGETGPSPENPMPPTMAEGDGHPREAPVIPNDTHKPHDAEEYDERATKFWSVYVDEAESHDKAQVETWKDDMEGILIFAGLFSASLTAFLVESYKNLIPNPEQDNVYYTRQSVQLLAQISAQLAAAGSPVPATVNLPPSRPDFHAAGSDVRINIFWFMSLVFSLTAALAATLVQQWVRDYMHVFQRYNHPLKRARVRQFLFEGTQGWSMAVVVAAVPALIHIGLFLFFIGLADFLFGLNTPTAAAVTVTIIICILPYLWSIFAPVHDAQSPYQSPLSGVFWYLFQLIRRRTQRDHSMGGRWKRISMDMTDGRVQLAMDESENRRKRDARAIRWVIDSLTEDSELEPFILGIPGSLNSTWGKKVWETVAEGEVGGNNNPSHATGQPEAAALVLHNPASGPPPAQHAATATPAEREDTLGDLGSRIMRLLKTCTDPGILPTEDARRKRAHACVDASLSLVLTVEHEWEWFAEPETMARTLVYLGDPYTSGLEPTFAVRWTCMLIIVVRKMLQTPVVRDAAQRVITCLADARGEQEGDPDDVAIKTVGTIDQYLKSGWDSAVSLDNELTYEVEPDKAEERFRDIIRTNKAEIAELEYTWNNLGWLEEIDEALITLVRTMMAATGHVLDNLPHIVSQWQPDPRRTPPEKGMRAPPAYLMPQFIPPRMIIQRLWTSTWLFRTISASGWGSSMYQPKTLGEFSAPELRVTELRELMDSTPTPMRVQLWRLQDLRDGGLVYMLELFVSAIRSGTAAASHHSSHPFYIGTFRSITADWKERRHAIWTQRLLVNLLRQVLPRDDDAPVDEVPGYIIDEFLFFVGNVLAEKKGSHVIEAIEMIRTYDTLRGGTQEIAQKAIATISPPKPPKHRRTRSSGPRVATD